MGNQSSGEPPYGLEPGEKPNWLLPYEKWSRIAVRTIESLGIDVEGARTDPSRLIPAEVCRKPHARHWPLPESRAELQLIADLPIQSVPDMQGTPAERYVTRARWHLKRHKSIRAGRADKYVQEDRIAAGAIKSIQKAKNVAETEVHKVREVARQVRTTLLDTSIEFDRAFGAIAEAFNDNRPLPSGEVVTIRDIIAAYKGFYAHMDKLGGPITEEMAEEAQEVVFMKAVEASRNRIARTLRAAIPAKVADAKTG